MFILLAALIRAFFITGGACEQRRSEMDQKILKRFEYEEQMFQFSSQFFTECFRNFIHNELDSSVDGLIRNFKKKLIKETKNSEVFLDKLEEMRSKLKAEYKMSMEMEMKKIQEDIEKFMNIPEHVLLREDLPIKLGSGKSISDLEKEVKDVKGRFKSMLYFKKKINEEIILADSAIFVLDSIISKKDANLKILDTSEINSLRKSNLSMTK